MNERGRIPADVIAKFEAARLLTYRVVDQRVRRIPDNAEANLSRIAALEAVEELMDFLAQYVPDCLAGGDPLLEDYYRIESVSATAISPDGRWVVWVRNSILEAENQRHTELWMSPSDGSTPPVRLTNPAFNATAPRWSPDGHGAARPP